MALRDYIGVSDCERVSRYQRELDKSHFTTVHKFGSARRF